jgi:hypothetical protein
MGRHEFRAELCQNRANLAQRTQVTQRLHWCGEVPQDDHRYLALSEILDERSAPAGENGGRVTSCLQSHREITNMDLGSPYRVGSGHN